ncbi:MAG: glycosyltransferase family 92 protein [Candidatus Dependentiae bacterium]|nr:glycosyltransferase family 92 protein [Candidatus Dependentiae bacterium]
MVSLKRFFVLIIFCITPCVFAYQHELAVCAIFQNESRFLKEWLEFYKLVGVQHFYLYDNNSTDNYREILYPYIKAGEVDLIPWPYSNKHCSAQLSSYNHCLSKVRGKVKWLAFLDLDEFLFAVQHDNLRDFLKGYEKFGAVCANWVMFGTSDVDEVPQDRLMIEVLTKRAQQINKHVKSIVQPDKLAVFKAHSAIAYFDDYFQVTPDKEPFWGPFSPSLFVDKLRINHYWPRDKKWLYEIKIPRAEDLKTNLMVSDDDCWYLSRQVAHSLTPTQWTIAITDFMNAEKDLTIERFVLPLRKAMGLDDQKNDVISKTREKGCR